MTTIRRAFTLVEIIAALAVLLGFLAASATLFPALVRDVPRDCEVIQTHTRLQKFLNRLRDDVDHAVALHRQTDPNHPPILVIERSDGRVSYRQTGDIFQRCFTPQPSAVRHHATFQPPPNGNASAPSRQPSVVRNTWSLPQAHITWEIWQPDAAAQALIVRTGIDYQPRNHQSPERRLVNTHIYFAGMTDSRIP